MTPLEKGRLRARLAGTARDMAGVLALRALCFRGDRSADDRDGFDDACDHLLIETRDTGAIVGACRLMLHPEARIRAGYAAQFYDLTPLSALAGPKLELGRFCTDPDWPDGDVLRLAWGALTRQVDATGTTLLFGATSFAGSDVARHAPALHVLRERHGGPAKLCPGIRAGDIVPLVDLPPEAGRTGPPPELPPLLRTYLAMGGWVGDHAVVDRELDTLHVFTALEIARVPPRRARLLRAVAR